jgi:hypothetical protein
MYHDLPRGAGFWHFLVSVDQDLAQATRQKACRCGGRLHRANYPRKPRGVDDLPADYAWRFSFCCARDGCRKRVTPPSVRFLGRKVYLFAVVVLVSAMRQGPSPRRVRQLTQLFGFLNEATQAWVEVDYNRAVHRELSCPPVERFAKAPDVLRSSPSSDDLRAAFRLDAKRRQRHSDGTISLEGVRFEVPARFRHFRELVVRYARWDLSRVDLVDPRHGTLLAPLYPLDRAANADGRRARVAPPTSSAAALPQKDRQHSDTLPPLLQKILAAYSATGLPPAYLPQTTTNHEEGDA